MSKNAIPKNYQATPYLICRNAVDALKWYCKAFGATEMVCLDDDTKKVMHAEIRIGEAAIMLADEFPDMGYKSPETIGGSAVSILVYVEDVDLIFARAIELGAKEVMPISDQFDGDRRGTLVDPYGHIWLLATRKEDISMDELKLRFNKMMQSGS
ncbi:MAG: VOC family protein [Alphaproteobacteria bacterium]|nr:VOC family protein [Alphaproteobacteria bacterium]